MTLYVPLFRRKREGLTDFRVRKKAIMSGEILAVIRKSTKNITVQFIKPEVNGDRVIFSSHSRVLRKFGWLGSLKSTPAAYLLGLYAGKEAIKHGIKRAVVYTGLLRYVKGSRISALVKGLVDSGLDVPSDKETFPGEERITGKFIADYASSLLEKDKEKYRKIFSRLLKEGFKPEEYPEYFEKVRKAIVGG
jgi:large subunit ribosomal protein L18